MKKRITWGAVALLGLLAVAARPAAQGSPVGQFSRVTAFINVTFSMGPMSLGVASSIFGYSGMFLAAAAVTVVSLGVFHAYTQRHPAAGS